MRRCPKCAFENDDRFPTCVWCNTSLAEVKSIIPEDPAHRDREASLLSADRSRRLRRRLHFATIFYAGVIAATALFPGFVTRLEILALYAAAGLLVGTGVAFHFFGQFSGGFAQGFCTLALIVCFGPVQPFIFFMLVAHISFAGLLWHWMNMITDAHR